MENTRAILTEFLHDFGFEVENLAHFVSLLSSPHRPHSLELSIMKGKSYRNCVREEMQQCCSAMIIIHVIYVRRESLDSFGNTLIPSTAVKIFQLDDALGYTYQAE